MKRKLLIFFSIVILLGFIPLNVRAEDSYIDQKNDEDNGIGAGSAAYRIYGREPGQSFKPTVNRITRADYYLKYPVPGGWINVNLVDASNGMPLAEQGHRMPGEEGWDTMYFDEIEVEPGQDYFLYLVITESSYNTMWARTSSNTYDDGVLTIDGDMYGDRDFGFRIWGYTYSEEEPPPEEEEEEEQEEEQQDDTGELPETGEDDSQDTQEQTNEPNDNTYSVDAKDTDEVVKEEDESVEAPTLEYVKKNEEEVEDMETIEAESVDTITIGGSSFANAKIIIIIGEKAYEVTSDSEGNWSIIVDMKDIEPDEYDVMAQAIDLDGNGSKKVSLFKLTRLEEEKDTVQPTPVSTKKERSLWYKLTLGSLRYISLIILGLLLIGLIVLLLIIVAKNEKKDKGKTGKKEKKFEKEDPKKENMFKENLMKEAENK